MVNRGDRDDPAATPARQMRQAHSREGGRVLQRPQRRGRAYAHRSGRDSRRVSLSSLCQPGNSHSRTASVNRTTHVRSFSYSVIGLSDGLTVPFALTAGLSSLGESKLVILGGFAELIAGAISMGIGGFLASQAERDHYRYLKKCTAARVVRSCDGEMEREVYGVLGPVGVDEKTSRMVAKCLRDVEIDTAGEGSSSGSRHTVEDGPLKWSATVGLSAFLLKFGEGLEEVPTRRLYISAFTIGMGYLLGGFIPLLPYFFSKSSCLLHYFAAHRLISSSCCPHCPDLLMHPHWHRPAHLWCSQSPCYWCCRQGHWWIPLWRH